MAEFAKRLELFEPIRLAEMDKVQLMNRVDTKFIFHKNDLDTILARLQPNYRTLEIDGARTSTYENVYFDTQQLKFYLDHHNGKKSRSKVRIRRYVETKDCFIEVKNKSNKGRTSKKRKAIPEMTKELPDDVIAFITDYVSVTGLQPVLSNSFKRITLVSLLNKERITIDTELTYNIPDNSLKLEGLVIVELKQETLNRNTPLFTLLKSYNIKPYRISKYCVGMAGIYPELKQNNFKKKMRKIYKIAG